MGNNHDHHHSHHHSHAHSSGHHHHHSHAPANPANYNRAFAIGIVLNLIFVFIEAIYGFLSHSLALVADAGHNLSDVIGLAVAWVAFWLSAKKPTTHFTYGLKRSSILSALFNSIFLLVAIGAIILEAVKRFWSPDPVQSGTMIAVASVGIVINTATALLFMKDSKHDLNIKGAYLHMAADAAISLGVVIAGIAIYYTNWNWIDPTVSIAICIIIVIGTWGLLKDSVKLSMDAVPESIDPIEVRTYLEKIEGIKEVHDLHIWAISTTETALSVHLVVPKPQQSDKLLEKISKDLKEQFKINHPTIQFESGEEGFNCELKPQDVV